MQPKLNLLTPELIAEILDDAYKVMMNPGIKVQLPEARELLAKAGAEVDEEKEVVRIPKEIAQKALETTPKEFYLHDRDGNKAVHYGGDSVHFDPGSAGVNVLDPDTQDHRPGVTADFLKIIKIADSLPQYDAQSTALVCSEIPKEVGDLYRLYLILLHSKKPIVTGAFSADNTNAMIDMLAIFAGGRDALAEKPMAVFDVCPSPPLIWSHFGSQSLIYLARAGVPAEMVSMPISGVAAPITLLGSVVQHAAECISGITIHQLAKAGSPIVWGGAPAIMDMRQGTTPMGAIETSMVDSAYAQVGKSLGMPTHTYQCATDSKTIDMQAGLESGMTALSAALSGINMISGAGMLDFLAATSPEKLVIDAEIIGMAKRMLQGMKVHTSPLASGMYEGIDYSGEFLKQKITRDLVREEQYLPSPVIDRGSIRNWQAAGKPDTLTRAKKRVQDILDAYQPPDLPEDKVVALKSMMQKMAADAGLDKLPDLE